MGLDNGRLLGLFDIRRRRLGKIFLYPGCLLRKDGICLSMGFSMFVLSGGGFWLVFVW